MRKARVQECKRSQPVERRKVLEERKARITRRGDRTAETTGACAEQRAVLSLRASGAPQFDVPCEDGSRASLEAKKRAAAPETMNSAADMVLDSAAEESRQHCNQARPVARPEAKREAGSNSGRSSAQLRQASSSAGKRSASTQTAEGVRKRRCHHKSDGPRSAHPILGVASGPRRQTNVDGRGVGAENVHNKTPRRIRKSTRPGNVVGERAAFYCEFEAGEKQRRAAHKGTAVADGGW
ncbi:hypothetical protein ERJ75_000666000 [Trypanosoma vivax]|nr:hypothetical protein ERJ75_000666000 [Trypanosoma vivax]